MTVFVLLKFRLKHRTWAYLIKHRVDGSISSGNFISKKPNVVQWKQQQKSLRNSKSDEYFLLTQKAVIVDAQFNAKIIHK